MDIERDLAVLEHDRRSVAADLVDEQPAVSGELEPGVVGDRDHPRLIVGDDRRPGAELGIPDPKFERVAVDNLRAAFGQREQDREGAGGGRQPTKPPPPRAAPRRSDHGRPGLDPIDRLQQTGAGAGVLARISQLQLLVLRLSDCHEQARVQARVQARDIFIRVGH